MKNNYNFLDGINVASFLIGLQNLEENQKQIQALEEHLINQDKQYEEIIKLLKEFREI